MKFGFTFVLLTLGGCAHTSSEVLGGGLVEIECRHPSECYEEAVENCGRWGFDVKDRDTETGAVSRIGTTYVAHNRTTMLIQCRPPTSSEVAAARARAESR